MGLDQNRRRRSRASDLILVVEHRAPPLADLARPSLEAAPESGGGGSICLPGHCWPCAGEMQGGSVKGGVAEREGTTVLTSRKGHLCPETSRRLWIRRGRSRGRIHRWKAEALYQSFLPAAWLSSRSWWIYFRIFARTLVYLGVLRWPLALPSTGAGSRRVLLCSAAFVFMVTVAYGWHSGRKPPPLQYGETLSLEELGASRALISREELSRPIPGRSVWVLLGLALT